MKTAITVCRGITIVKVVARERITAMETAITDDRTNMVSKIAV